MALSDYETVIGLEVHCQLKTKTKSFCSCPVVFGAPPNSAVCPVCLGYPGVLPVLNREMVTLAMGVALAAGCEIREHSVFARKNYFYPDLPKGYQISQLDRPLAVGGSIPVRTGAGERSIRLSRIHLEEDAGKLMHEFPWDDVPGGASLVDLNRAGTPLIEIVSEPDLRSGDEAWDYLGRLRRIVRYVDASDGNMEEGSLRCDANVSVRRRGEERLGTKVEIKNLNSINHVRKAIEHEAERQVAVLERGGALVQETRLWNPETGTTRPMRSKEEAMDYRYFPDPDLGTLVIDDGTISGKIAKELLPLMIESDRDPDDLIKEKGLVQVTDEGAIRAVVESVVAANPQQAADYRAGRSQALGWFVGQVMKASGGKANPAIVNRLLKERLGLN